MQGISAAHRTGKHVSNNHRGSIFSIWNLHSSSLRNVLLEESGDSPRGEGKPLHSNQPHRENGEENGTSSLTLQSYFLWSTSTSVAEPAPLVALLVCVGRSWFAGFILTTRRRNSRVTDQATGLGFNINQNQGLCVFCI